jgi:hypothetical protein
MMLGSLPPIPPDPVPARDELALYIKQLESTTSDENIRKVLAELSWNHDRKRADPNAFWHPFAPADHDKYLRSALWRRIRSKVLEDANYQCACCPNKANQVHHRCYRPRVLSGEDTSLLIAMCPECHDKVDWEDKRNKKNRDSQSKERVLQELYSQRTYRP